VVRDGRAATLKLPKVELHVHLEATPRPTTLKDLAREQNEDLPARLDPDSDVPLEFDSLMDFLLTLRKINRLFVPPDIYGRLLYEYLASQAAANVVYCKVRFSPVRPVQDRGMYLGKLIAELGKARDRAREDFGIDLGLILSLSRTRDPGASRDLTAETLRVADGVLAQSDTGALGLGGERASLSLLCTDIRGFSTFLEQMDPHALVDFLNEYLTEMTDLVFDEEGVLDKYIGDAVMAFWGWPLKQEDHAVRAMKTSIRMVEKLKVNVGSF